MALILNNPGVVPATAETTYPILWLSNFSIMARDPNQPVTIVGQVDKMRVAEVDENGQPTRFELMPNGGVRIHINDFFNNATPEQLAVAGQLLALVQAIADPPAPPPENPENP